MCDLGINIWLGFGMGNVLEVLNMTCMTFFKLELKDVRLGDGG